MCSGHRRRLVPAVNRRKLGRTGLSVSELEFGTAPIGNLYTAVHDDAAHAAADEAWSAGIRYFDTAPHYGLGLAERRFEAALSGRPRTEYVISTKVGRMLVTNPNSTGSDRAERFDAPDTCTRAGDYSRDGARRSLEASLRRLDLHRVDIALVHDPDEPDQLDQAITETIPALIDLRDQGMVTAVGAAMNNWQPLLCVVIETDVDTVMIAGRWTPLDHSAEPLLDACAERDVAVRCCAVQLRPARPRLAAGRRHARLPAGTPAAARTLPRLPAARRRAPRCRAAVPATPPRSHCSRHRHPHPGPGPRRRRLDGRRLPPCIVDCTGLCVFAGAAVDTDGPGRVGRPAVAPTVSAVHLAQVRIRPPPLQGFPSARLSA